MSDRVWGAQLRVRAWYRIFVAAEAAANQTSLADLRLKLIEAIAAIDEAAKAGEV